MFSSISLFSGLYFSFSFFLLFICAYNVWVISPLYFSLKRSLVSFVKFIPRYFILFEAMVSMILSLISLSVCSLLVYRKATDFCMLIL
jgi:hypothetical protein